VITEAVKTIGVTKTAYFRWRAEYGGMKSDQVKQLKHEAVSIVQISPLREGPAGVTTFNGRVKPNFVVS
jgi:hypothetical protein